MREVLCRNMKIWPLNGRGLGPFISSEWLNSETSYLVHTLNMTYTSQRTTKWPIMWVWSGSRDINLKFGNTYPPITFEQKMLRTPNYVGWYIAWSTLSTDKNMTPKGAWLRSCDGVSKSRNPFISSERLKVDTSYLVHALNVTWTRQCTTNCSPKVGVVGFTWPIFKIWKYKATWSEIGVRIYSLSADKIITLNGHGLCRVTRLKNLEPVIFSGRLNIETVYLVQHVLAIKQQISM